MLVRLKITIFLNWHWSFLSSIGHMMTGIWCHWYSLGIEFFDHTNLFPLCSLYTPWGNLRHLESLSFDLLKVKQNLVNRSNLYASVSMSLRILISSAFLIPEPDLAFSRSYHTHPTTESWGDSWRTVRRK